MESSAHFTRVIPWLLLMITPSDIVVVQAVLPLSSLVLSQNHHVSESTCDRNGATITCYLLAVDRKIDLSSFPGKIVTVRVFCDKNNIILSKLTDGFFESLKHTLEFVEMFDCNFFSISRQAFRGLKRLTYLSINGECYSESVIALPVLDFVNCTRQSETEYQLPSDAIKSNQDNFLLPNGIFYEVNNLYSLHLMGMRLNSSVWTELEILRKLSVLRLDCNNLNSINIDTTSKLNRLVTLYLNENHIQSILNGTFESLLHLYRLNLSDNKINHIEWDGFKGLISLDTLDLSRNRIRIVQRETFKDSIYMEWLDLSENNINTIAHEALSHLTSLWKLNLSCNNIHNLPNFPRSLLYLDLSNNDIISLSNNSFASLRLLSLLDLSSNKIRFIESCTFRELDSLYVLKLSRNKIKTVNVETFQGLTKLRLLDMSVNQIQIIAYHALSDLLTLSSLNLSCNNIESFPAFPSSLTLLNLSKNDITSIDNSSFTALPLLKWLNLTSNKITVIKSNAFNQLKRLYTLDLSRNRIRTVEKDAFNGLAQLRQLVLTGNEIQLIAPQAFSQLTSLWKLDLSYDQIEKIPTFPRSLTLLDLRKNNIAELRSSSFTALYILHELRLSNNGIRVIERDTFKGLRELYILDLSVNKIRTVETDTFKELVKLRQLDLSKNRIKTIAYQVLGQLKSVEKLSLSYNQIKKLPNIPRSLTSLDLSHNKIFDLGTRSFANVTGLAKHDLSTNRIRIITLYNIPDNMVDLNLSSNELSVISFTLTPTLRYADLRNNQLSSVTIDGLKEYRYANGSGKIYLAGNGNSFQCVCSLEVTNKELPFKYDSRNDEQYRIWNLTLLYCSLNNKSEAGGVTKISAGTFMCNTPCHDNCTCYYWRYNIDTINIVKCLNAHLRAIPVNISASCTILDLSGNGFRSLMPGNFYGLSQLVELYLNFSKITEIKIGTFRGLFYLRKLDIRHNKICRLQSGIFEGLSRLVSLYISYNDIHVIMPGTLQYLNKVNGLDLSNNVLETIPGSEIARMYTITSLKLSNNTWSCECIFLEKLMRLVIKTNVQDKDNIICRTSNKTELFITHIYMPEFCLNESDMSGVIAITITTAACVFAVTVTIFILWYKKRKFLKVCCFVHFGWKFGSTPNDEQDKPYDAFVSYSSWDDAFVARELMPRLEGPLPGKQGYTLCVHFRDFPVGASIAETILDAVKYSRRVIMIISDNFLRSEWCHFEFQAAHLQLMREKKSRIITVLLHDINTNLLDDHLRMFLSTITYVKYGDPLFWNKIEYAMPKRKPATEDNVNADNHEDQVNNVPAVIGDDARLIP